VPRRASLAIAVAALVLALAGIAIVTIDHSAEELAETAPATVPPPPAAAPPPAGTPGDPDTDWQLITNPAAVIGYRVPPDWQVADPGESLLSSNGVQLGHLADWGTYACQGAEYGRAFVASGLTASNSLHGTANALAASVAADQYSDGAQTASVRLTPPTTVTASGTTGVLVRATASSTAGADRCTASEGDITVLALPTRAGTAVLVIGADTVPGTEQPSQLVRDDDIDRIADTLELLG
jgi:hypothetical protein